MLATSVQKIRKSANRFMLRNQPLKLEGTEVLKVFIDKYPSKKHDFFVASVLDVVGHSTDVGIDVLEVLESMDIVSEFPEAVLQGSRKCA